MSRFSARVDDQGRIVPDNPDRTLALHGQKVYYQLFRAGVGGIRSNASNRLLWGAIYAEIARETEMDPREVHYGCKRKAVQEGILPPAEMDAIDQEPTTVQEQEVFNRYVTWLITGCREGTLVGQRVHLEDLL